MKATLLRRVVLPAWQYVRGQDGFPRLRYLDRTQWLSPGELQDLQWRRIGELLEHAYANVPYYSDVMRRLGVEPSSLVRERSLARLPLLDRATINEQAASLRAGNVAPDRFVANGTGGSTGEPLRFFDDRNGFGWGTAALWRAQRWIGIDVGERSAYLWGANFDLTSFRGVTGRVKSSLLNTLMLSAWELSDSTAPVFWRRLFAYRPRLLVAYAGALHEMAVILGPDREPIPSLRAIVVSADLLTDEARATIEACFKVPVYNRYGGRDIKFIAQECTARQGLHINAENVLVEIVKDGKPVPSGEVGEIAITRLDNFAMPFVRYRSGDLATMTATYCTCGRSLPLLQKLEGRTQDAIVTAEGRVISGLFFFHMFKDCPDVRAFQIHQTALDRLLILVVLAGQSGFSSRARVDRIIRQHFGAGMRIEFEVRDSIPLTRSGKRRVVVSYLHSSPDSSESLTAGAPVHATGSSTDSAHRS
jgi:phenylacetate-CoA ligase